MTTHEGIIEHWNPAKAYGFTLRDDGTSFFFHKTKVVTGHMPSVAVGVRVSFTIAPPLTLGKSPQAVNVTVLQTLPAEEQALQSFFNAFVDKKGGEVSS